MLSPATSTGSSRASRRPSTASAPSASAAAASVTVLRMPGMISRRPCATEAGVVVTSAETSIPKGTMPMLVERLAEWLRPTRVVHAHCDLPCGVYDPAQARIEAESMAKIVEKYHATDKHHLWVLWTDYFKPQHLEAFPNLHDLFWQATKAAGQAKHSVDPADQQKLLDLIDEIDGIFQKSKSG
jgi:nickel superoxide dismutase